MAKSYRDGHSNANEQHVGPERDRYGARLISELVIQAPGNGTSESERQRHTSSTDAQCDFPVPDKVAKIDFQSNKEQEEE